MTDKNATRVAADDRTITTFRIIDAPRDLVFEAWTTPAHLAQWWGPTGFSTTTHAFDLRPGGIWRFVMHGPDGRDYENRIIFDAICRPERIEYRHGGGDDVEPVQFQTTVLFEETGGRTKITMRAIFPSKEACDRVVREYGADEGAQETVGRLAAYIGAARQNGLDKPTLTIVRSFAAPLSLVWKAHSELEHLKKWWGPKGFTWIAGTLDFRPGGRFHYGMRSPAGAEMWGKFDYREIRPQERIIFTNSFSDKDAGTVRAPFAPDWPLEVLNTLLFSERNGKTLLAMSGTPLNATEAELKRFDAMKPSMNQGFGGTYDQLAAYLETL